MEIRVGNLLAEAIQVDLSSRYLHLPDGRVEVDIPFPEHRVLIEYDGGFWHDPETDLRKNGRLAAAGWRVLRVRQAPLERLEPWDIEVDAGEPDPVHVALFVLGRLRHSFGLDVPTHLTQAQVERALAAAEVRIEDLMTRAATARPRRCGTSRKGAGRAA